jgi:hypothetical protein
MRIITFSCLMLTFALASAAVVGCSKSASTSNEEAGATQATESSSEANAEIMAAMAELSAEDRLAAEAQKFCAVEQESRLGSMGTPFKVMVEGRPVFLCCEGCKEAALRDPQATLAAVSKLKQGHSSDN